jgi:hypothetical protein
MPMLALDPKAQISSPAEACAGVIEIPLDKPDGFNLDLWALLQAVKTAGIPLRGKIAEYAGFYYKVDATITTAWDPTSDNGVNPDLPQTGASQPNKSLDKLTFLIMFRLPFQGEVVEVSPPLTNPEADLYNNRKIVKKDDNTYALGAFHEILDSEGNVTSVLFQLCTVTRSNPIDNFEIGGKDLFYDTPTDSFYVYGGNNGPYVSHFGDPMANPIDTDATTGTWSRRANVIRSASGLKRLNGAGEQVALVGGVYKHVDDAGNEVSFDYHTTPTPETANAYTYYGIDFNDLYPEKVPAESIGKQATINTIKTVPLYYFLTVYTENRPQSYDRSAHFPENQLDPLYSDATHTLIWRTRTTSASGLTFGLGYDIGGNFKNAYVYDINFKIQKKTGMTGDFTLSYADRSRSVGSNRADVKLKLSQMIGIDQALIDIKDATSFDPGYSSGWVITIKRGMSGQADASRYFNVYSHELKYSPAAGENPPNVLITPTDEARYVERASGELPQPTAANPHGNYQTLETLLNGFFVSGDFTNPGPNEEDKHKIGFDPAGFKAAVKSIIGLSGGPAGVVYWNNDAPFKAFQMPPWERTLVQNYALVFKVMYFTDDILSKKVTSQLQSGALPNVIEKVLFASINYATPGLWLITEYATDSEGKAVLSNNKPKKSAPKRFDPSIKLALSSHNQYELINVFKNRIPTQPDRREHRVGYVRKFQHILYRGVEA